MSILADLLAALVLRPVEVVVALGLRYLGPCVAPEVLDAPLVSAVVAVRRLVVLERVYGLRTPRERAEAWRRGASRRRAT